MKIKKIYFSLLLGFFVVLSIETQAEPSLWSTTSLAQLSKEQQASMPDKYKIYQLDEKAMLNKLKNGADDLTAKTLDVPMPDGKMIHLVITEKSVMSPELSAKYPNIKTFAAKAPKRPVVSGILGVNARGFHSMLFVEEGHRAFIDRRTIAGQVYYLSYYDKDNHPASNETKRDDIKRHNLPNTPQKTVLPPAQVEYRIGGSGSVSLLLFVFLFLIYGVRRYLSKS
jgi:hypothetical protein